MSDRGLRNTTINLNWNVNGQPLHDANRLVDEAIRSSRTLDQQNAQAGRQIEQTGHRYANAANQVRQNSNSLQENSNRARDTDQQHTRLSRSARDSGESFNGQSQNIENASRSLGNFKTSAEKLDGTLKMIGVGYFADKVLDIGKSALQTGMEFGKQMSSVQAISGATGDQFNQLRDQAIQLGASTTKSASEVASGQLEMAKSGFTVNQTLAAMPGLISASTASGEDMARTAEVMTAALNSFNLSADQSNHVANVLAQAANDSAADINDLGYAFKYAAAPAHALGMSLEEVSAATEIMANAGIKGDTAGTALRSSLLRLANPTKEVSGELDDLGVKVTDSHGKMLPFSNIIGQLNEKTKNMADAQKTAALSTIFGTDAVSGMIPIVDAGSAKFEELTKSLQTSDGASAKAAKTMNDNFAGAVENLGGTIESIAINVSDVLTPSVKAATEWLSDMGEKFNDLSPTGKQVAVWASVAVAGVVPVVYIIKKASEVVGWLKDALSNMHSPFSSFRREMDDTSRSASEMVSSVQNANNALNDSQSTSSSRSSRSARRQSQTSNNNEGNAASSSGETRTSRRNASRRGFFPRIFSRGSNTANSVGQEVENVAETASSTASRVGRLAKVGSVLAKGSGYLSMGLSAIDLIKSTKDNIVENVGGMAGSSAGMAIGAAIGSAIAPGIGTAIGGAVGSWAGTYLGSTIGTSIQKSHPGIVKSFSSAMDSIKGIFKNPLDTSFKASDGISKSTAKSINDYEKLNQKASEQLGYLAMSGDTMSAKTAESIHKNFNDMESKIDSALDKKASKSKSDLDLLVESGALSPEDAAKASQTFNDNLKKKKDDVAENNKQMNALLDKMNQEQADSTKKATDQITAIKGKALKEGRKLTSDELYQISKLEKDAAEERKTIAKKYNDQISSLQEKQENNAVTSMSRGAKEQNIILGKLANSTEKLSAQQAASIVKHSKASRDEAVKAANDKYNKVMKAADEEYYVNHSISKEQYETIKSNAEKTRDDAVKAANDMHNKVVDQAQKQASGHISQVDWETGQSLSKWDNFVVGLAEKVNAVSSGINKVLDFFHISAKVPMWKPAGYDSAQSLKTENYKPNSAVNAKLYHLETGYASGTNYHLGGHSLVGEEGPELAYTPYTGKVSILGANGPEVTNIPRGTTILPASQTKLILNGGLGAGKILPGYASGVGDFFKEAYDWVQHPMESLKNLVGKNANLGNAEIGPGQGIGKGILNYIQSTAGPWLKDNLSPFSGMGAGGKAAPEQVVKWILSAISATGVPASWLQPLMTIAMKESGGNPSVVNNWDSNAKAGHASQGLFQTIPSTFAAYALTGMKNILNPVDNAVAAINYIKARYGTPFNTPGIKSLASGGKYKGYKDGGAPPIDEDVLVGEDGPEIFKTRTPGQIFNAQKTQQILKNQNGTKIEINAPVTITIQGNADKGVESNIKKVVDSTLDEAFKKWIRVLGLEMA